MMAQYWDVIHAPIIVKFVQKVNNVSNVNLDMPHTYQIQLNWLVEQRKKLYAKCVNQTA